MTVKDRLDELGITLPDSAAPAGVYRAAVRTGNLVYIAGQVNTRDGTFTARGKLGTEVDLAMGQAAARQCAINCLAAAAGFDLVR